MVTITNPGSQQSNTQGVNRPVDLQTTQDVTINPMFMSAQINNTGGAAISVSVTGDNINYTISIPSKEGYSWPAQNLRPYNVTLVVTSGGVATSIQVIY